MKKNSENQPNQRESASPLKIYTMSEKRINEILDRYWTGETSLEEEADLRKYFAQSDLPAEHEQFRTLFGFYAKEAERQMPEGEVRSTQSAVRSQITRAHSFTRSILIASIAAAFALLISFSIFFTPQQQDHNHISLTADSFDDPEEAYEAARKALLLVSARLNAGKKFQQEFRPIRRVSEILYPKMSKSP